MNYSDCIKEQLNKMNKTVELIPKEQEKHLKGYMFDSLVYRYRIALEENKIYKIKHLMETKNISRSDAEERIEDRNNRDLMRFIQILDEAIGEHD